MARHGVAHYLALLANGGMGLAVLVGAEMELFGILAAGHGFHVVIVGIGLAALLYHVFGELQIAALAGGMVEAHQGQLDLRVAAVAAALARIGAKLAVDVVGVAGQAVEQLGVARGLIVGHGGLHEVAGAVHLVPVAQVFPASSPAGSR